MLRSRRLIYKLREALHDASGSRLVKMRRRREPPGQGIGPWVIKGTRVPAQAIVDNARAGCSAEEIATEIFELPLERVKAVLRFAKIDSPSSG